MSHTHASPACPFCGEHQAYDEARPSKPRVITYWDYTKAWGTYQKRETVYDTECRACGERIVWGMQYGSGRMSEFGRAPERYSWGKPSTEVSR